MKKLPQIGIIGGDERQYYTAIKLREMGFPVLCFAIRYPASVRIVSALSETSPESSACSGTALPEAGSLSELMADTAVLVCPTPFSKDGIHLYTASDKASISIADLLLLAPGLQMLFAGYLPAEMRADLFSCGCQAFDFSSMEIFNLYNATATAEGAVAEALLHSSCLLAGSSCLLLGYGKCGSALAGLLSGMHAGVTVWDRDENALSQAVLAGHHALPHNRFPQNLSPYLFLFNTIPAKLLTADTLKTCSSNVLITDIASLPGGVDDDAAARLSLQVLHTLSLPGRYAPETMGHCMAQLIASYSLKNIGKK